jgi:ribosomal protein L17
VEFTVTCYFRHLAQVFEKASIEVTPANKQEIDRIIHDIVGVTYKNCPAAWRQVKSRVLEDEANFVLMLKDAWKNRQES